MMPNEPAYQTQTPDSDAWQPEEIVQPYADLLEAHLGPLLDLCVQQVGDDEFTWTGIDESGDLLSGNFRPVLETGEDQASMVLRWEVTVDEVGSR